MPILIRPAVEADAPTIVEFNKRLAWETEHIQLDDARITPGVAKVFSDPSKGFYLVADDGGRVVGQLMITFEWSDWRDGWMWWIQSVYVHADARRLGVFRSLFEQVERIAREQGDVAGIRLYVERENERGQHTYCNMGMDEIPFNLYQKLIGQTKY